MQRCRLHSSFFGACAILALLLPFAAGCVSPRSDPDALDGDGGQQAARSAAHGLLEEEHVLGHSVGERPITATVMGDGAETVMILASIHGSEPAGTPLVEKLMERLRAEPALLEGLTLVVVPVVNPDGYALRRRHNDHGVDLNRNFPSSNRENKRRHGPEGLSEPESRAIFDLLADFPPTRVVSIHQPLTCVDFDGPALAVARAMAEHCDLKVKRLGSRPGSLGSYVGVDLRVPIITFELRKGDEEETADALWERYGSALLAFLAFGA